MLNSSLDLEALATRYQNATPFPSICIDDFLDPAFADEAARSFPSFSEAESIGGAFDAVNERRKVQVTNPADFPEPIQRVMELFADPDFIAKVSTMTGIPNLVWDPEFTGGGMHQTASSGLLDVHVDFNRIDALDLYRRVNILLYLNPEWDDDWGGCVELWDEDVKQCHHRLSPILNRCVIFSTSEISYHGVTAVACPPGVARKSIALYYYTREAPPDFSGQDHTTIFKARPDETWKRFVGMPLERVNRQLRRARRFAERSLGRRRED